MIKQEVLSNTLSDQRFLEINKHTGHASQLRIQFEISNFIDRPVNVVEAGGVMHTLLPQSNPTVGRCLILKMDISAEAASVKIHAEKDYIESYLFSTLELVGKKYCKHRIIANQTRRRGQISYTAYFVFDAQDLLMMDNQLNIPECGLRLFVGESRRPIPGSREDWLEKLTPDLIPTNDRRASGIVVNCVDPKYRYDKLFYCIGKRVYEIDIDRSAGEQEGLYLGLWNCVSDLNIPVKGSVEFISFDAAASGDNPLGFMVFPSISEAENSLVDKKETKKTKAADDASKEKDAWDEKEKQAKVAQSWIKVTGDFIKSVLPTVLSGMKWMLKLLFKAPLPV